MTQFFLLLSASALALSSAHGLVRHVGAQALRASSLAHVRSTGPPRCSLSGPAGGNVPALGGMFASSTVPALRDAPASAMTHEVMLPMSDVPPLGGMFASSAVSALRDARAKTHEVSVPVVGDETRPALNLAPCGSDRSAASQLHAPSTVAEPLLRDVPLLPEGVPVAPPEDAAQVPSLREIVVFALPTLAMMLSGPLLSLIDTSVVGLAASTSQLAALGPSTKACDHLAYLCSALGVACTSLTAKELADGRTASAERVVATSLTSALAIGVGMAVGLAACAAPMMKLMMGAAPDAVALAGAVQYTSIRALGYPAALVAMVLQAGFIAHRDSKSPMMAVPFAAAANLLLDLILVGPLHLGAAGAAWGTVASQVVSAAFLIGTWKSKHGRPALTAPAWSPSQDSASRTPAPATPVPWWRPRAWRHQLPSARHRALHALSSVRSLFARPRRGDIAAQAAVVAPMMLAISARSGMALSFTATVASLGTVTLAAHQVFECLYWLFCPFGDALGVCSQAYLPKLLAAREALARKLQRRVSVASAALGAASGIAISWLALSAPQLFTRHAAVHTAMVAPAGWIGFAMFLYIISGALEGSVLARRKLRLLAASHVINFVLAVAALRSIAGQPGFGLIHVWQLYVAVNMAKVVQFGMALNVGGRQARRAEAQRDEARRGAAGESRASEAAQSGGGEKLLWDEALRPDPRLDGPGLCLHGQDLCFDGRETCLDGRCEAPEPRHPKVVHLPEVSLYELIDEAVPDQDGAPSHERRMQP